MTTAFIVKPEAAPAWHALAGLLTQLREDGHEPPCVADPDPFTSENYRERREAADACAWCPAVVACARFADDNAEPAHVWGGRDRTATTRNGGGRHA